MARVMATIEKTIEMPPIDRMARMRGRRRRKLSSPPADSAMSPMATLLTSFRSADHPLRDEVE